MGSARAATSGARIAPMRLLGAKTFKNYIDGQWVDPVEPKTLDVENPATEQVSGRIALGSGETFESTSPANGDTIGVFPKSDAADVERAVAVAKEAYEDWRLVPAPRRGEILFRFGQLLADQKQYAPDQTPSIYFALAYSQGIVVEQIIRPTDLTDPFVEVRPVISGGAAQYCHISVVRQLLPRRHQLRVGERPPQHLGAGQVGGHGVDRRRPGDHRGRHDQPRGRLGGQDDPKPWDGRPRPRRPVRSVLRGAPGRTA